MEYKFLGMQVFACVDATIAIMTVTESLHVGNARAVFSKVIYKNKRL